MELGVTDPRNNVEVATEAGDITPDMSQPGKALPREAFATETMQRPADKPGAIQGTNQGCNQCFHCSQP